MQAISGWKQEAIKAFRSTLSEARFSRYLSESKGDEFGAIRLYHWNSLLQQSLYISMQMWEIALRNRINEFLCWKYSAAWPYDNARARRALTANDQRRLDETIERQRQQRGLKAVPTDAIVADLSAGFWVSQLTKAYDVPYVWRHNLSRVFPSAKGMDRNQIWQACSDLLVLRNRMAHHEPIFHLPLPQRRADLFRLVEAMCPSAHAYAAAACTFDPIWAAGP